MPCCLRAPSHYPNQCWIIVHEDQCQSPRKDSQEIIQISIYEMNLKIIHLKFHWNYLINCQFLYWKSTSVTSQWKYVFSSCLKSSSGSWRRVYSCVHAPTRYVLSITESWCSATRPLFKYSNLQCNVSTENAYKGQNRSTQLPIIWCYLCFTHHIPTLLMRNQRNHGGNCFVCEHFI